MKNNKKTRKAMCLCGNVRFIIYGNLRSVFNCHCSQCMKTHGNYAAYTSCKERDIKFLSKKTLVWYKSSSIAKRGFCNKCGSSIFYKKFNTKFISISAGILKNPTKLKTKLHIYTRGKMDYYSISDKLPKKHKYI
tara:strand:+ start:102 stop:506 length:405 start_codon:yes stop_codon:yes gene_type:complete